MARLVLTLPVVQLLILISNLIEEVYPLQPSVAFLYPMKTSENLKVSCNGWKNQELLIIILVIATRDFQFQNKHFYFLLLLLQKLYKEVVRIFFKIGVLEISKYSKENICVGVFFYRPFLIEHLRWLLLSFPVVAN